MIAVDDGLTVAVVEMVSIYKEYIKGI